MFIAPAPEKKPEQEERVAPSVIKKPKAQVVDEGVDVVFECTLVANPAPQVSYLTACNSVHMEGRVM